MDYRYKVVTVLHPETPRRVGRSAEGTLESQLNLYAVEGWEFVQAIPLPQLPKGVTEAWRVMLRKG